MPFKKRPVGSPSAPSATDEEPSRTLAPGAIIAEINLLKPLSTAIDDDSPQFSLLNAIVLAKGRNKPVNLLHAGIEGPFRIRGTLYLNRQQKADYMLPTGKLPKHNTFELDDVSTYAVDNNPTNIWAAGKAGWYEIQPSSEYQAIYDHMMEGIDLFYTLEDFHTDDAQSTRRCPLTVDLLAQEYAKIRLPKRSPALVRETWLEHAKFLLGHMQKKSEVDWPKTPIYAWLAKSAPHMFKLYFPTGYHKAYPSPSSKANQLATLMQEAMESSPARHWTIDSLCKAIDYERVGLKSWEHIKEYVEVNATAIIQQLDDKYLGGSVASYLLEKAFERELELGNGADSNTDHDVGPEIHQRAKLEKKRRDVQFATTVVNGVMHHCITKEVYTQQELTIQNVAHQMWLRWSFKSEQAVVDRINAASEAILFRIGYWGLKSFDTAIAKELAWVNTRSNQEERKDERARQCVLRYREDYVEKEEELQNVLKTMNLGDDFHRDEVKAKTISLLVSNLLDDEELTFTTMTIDDLAGHMVVYLDLNDTDFATRVIKTNAEFLYRILDLKYANTPLRKELLDATVKETMIMDRARAEVELKPRIAMRKDSQPVVSEHIARAPSRNMSNASASAQPTPRRKSLMDTEMTDVQTPVQRHPAGKGAGKASTRRPVGTPLIPLREFSDDEDEGSPGFSSPKRRKVADGDASPSVSFAARNSPTSEPEIQYESEESDEEGVEYEYFLEEVDLGQTEAPNGPNGQWSCERENCTTVILAADQQEGRSQVRKHFLWHADEIEKRYNLVKSAERPYLPVSNLLKQLEKVGQKVLAKQEKEAEKDSNGNPIPKPIKRVT